MNTQLSATELALVKQIAELKAQLEQANKPRAVTLKVSDKGCVSVFGGRLRRFGVTLYATEFETLFVAKDQIEAFIKANATLIARK